jgi:hypothetical protein
MKKAEYIFYTLILIILLIVLLGKSVLWPWIGSFLIMSYCTLSFIIILSSWFIYSVEDNTKKRFFFIYGTIPLGLSIAILLIGTISKLQHWPWHAEAIRLALTLFIITAVILITSYKLIHDKFRKNYIKQLILKVLVFIGITIVLNVINFETFITSISSTEANNLREKWRIEAEQNIQEYSLAETHDNVKLLVEQTWRYHEKEKFIDSISNGKQQLITVASLMDTANNVWLVKVQQKDNQSITYFDFLVNAIEMKILNPTGEL